MITVGVRDLKNQLSQYLQYVKDGEKIIVTEHNRIIAEIIVPEKKHTNISIEKNLNN
jgi:prevent-host-death family protein